MISLLIGRVAAEIHANTIRSLRAPPAYSDDGARGKQTSRKPRPSKTRRHARQHNNMQAARQLFEP
jgi:hypothetical protein